ncbi:hypothetical protein TNCT_497581 [Trichonephila clavata]|uniref:Uncharacterized protein n=1 Tax=Trichonephila clavata TaxID=2740835 RepID=A0A8X6KVC3_TRICU|nr:hypothetical protein TNCT_497581 [Trichonephila clavata]
MDRKLSRNSMSYKISFEKEYRLLLRALQCQLLNGDYNLKERVLTRYILVIQRKWNRDGRVDIQITKVATMSPSCHQQRHPGKSKNRCHLPHWTSLQKTSGERA